MLKYDMDEIVNYLIEFREKEISVEELMSATKSTNANIQALFANYRATPECLERFRPKWKYIDKETGIQDTQIGAHLKWDKNRKELIGLENSHYVNELRELDLFLSEHLFGYHPKYGSTYCDNIDMDRAAWVTNSDYEVPFYSKKANYVDDLLTQLNNKSVEMNFNGTYLVSIENVVSAQAETLALAVSQAIAAYLRYPHRPAFFLVQESSEEDFREYRCVTPLLFSREESQAWINANQEVGYFYRIKELS